MITHACNKNHLHLAFQGATFVAYQLEMQCLHLFIFLLGNPVVVLEL
jgi:hypothetical protein